MGRGAKIEQIVVRTARISEKTDWTFVTVVCSDGIIGIGEASINGSSAALKDTGVKFDQSLRGKQALPNVLSLNQSFALGGMVQRAIVSAIEQALWDAQGKRLGRPVCDLLGGPLHPTVTLYANINRGISDRTAEGFATAAQQAAEAGFRYIKIAPFDGLSAAKPLQAQQAFAQGLSRIEAVCDAVEESVSVMVDCHWRLDEPMTVRLLAEAARLRLFWVECPMIESPQQLPSLRRIRSAATSLGVRLAGMEKGASVQCFLPYIMEQLYDVLMPDVKYDGGLTETQRIAALAHASGLLIAPHNPSGPIAHAASLHVSSTLPNILFLESQFNESPLFNSILQVPLIVDEGEAVVSDIPGLGVLLNEDVLREVEVK